LITIWNYLVSIIFNVGNKPSIYWNGKHPTYKNGDDWGMVRLWHDFTHITGIPRMGDPVNSGVSGVSLQSEGCFF
jgi:hypothetical protein